MGLSRGLGLVSSCYVCVCVVSLDYLYRLQVQVSAYGVSVQSCAPY